MSAEIGAANYEQDYTGSTQNVIKSVLLDKAAAGVTLNTVLEKEPAEVLEQIRTLKRTAEIPPHPLSTHPRVGRPVQEAVKLAVLALGANSADADLLRQVWLASPVAADYSKDYAPLEAIDVKKFSNWGK